MSPQTKAAAIILGGVLLYALILGGITYAVLLASSVADRTDEPEMDGEQP